MDFGQDAPRRRRLEDTAARPAVYSRRAASCVPATWGEAFAAIAARVKGAAPERIGAIAGDLCAVEEMFALKTLMAKLGSPNIECRQDGAKLDPAIGRGVLYLQRDDRRRRAGRRAADHRLEPAPRGAGAQCAHPQALARRQSRRSALIGESADLTYPYEYLGDGAGDDRRRSPQAKRFAEVLQGASSR